MQKGYPLENIEVTEYFYCLGHVPFPVEHQKQGVHEALRNYDRLHKYSLTEFCIDTRIIAVFSDKN